MADSDLFEKGLRKRRQVLVPRVIQTEGITF
jgi:hypothetical protein